MKLGLQAGTLSLSASNPEQGEASEDLEVSYQGQAVTVGFNARYLIETGATTPEALRALVNNVQGRIDAVQGHLGALRGGGHRLWHDGSPDAATQCSGSHLYSRHPRDKPASANIGNL